MAPHRKRPRQGATQAEPSRAASGLAVPARVLGVASGLAAITGTVVGFFTVFAYSFTDKPGGLLHPELLVAYAIVLVVYGVFALLLALWTGRGGWWWTAWGGGPGLVLLALYAANEPQGWPLYTIFAVLLAGGSLAGAWAGAAWSRRMRASKA